MLAVVGALLVVWAVAAAYAYYVYTQWSNAKENSAKLARKSDATVALGARLVKDTSSAANDVLVGHAREYRDVVRGLQEDHEAAMRAIDRVASEVRDEERGLVAGVRADEADLLAGTNLTKKVEREMNRDWPEHLAGYMGNWASLDQFRRDGLGVDDEGVMRATDFRAGDVSLLNLRSAVLANVGQYEIDDAEHDRNAKRLEDLRAMSEASRSDILAKQAASETALAAGEAAISSNLSRFVADRVQSEAERIRGAFQTTAASFEADASAVIRRAASVGMMRVVAGGASNLRVAGLELDSLLEQSDFNAKLVELERRNAELQTRLEASAASAVGAISTAVSTRELRDGALATGAAERVAAIQAEVETKYANLLRRDDVVKYLEQKSKAYAESLFQLQGPNAVLTAGSIALTGGSPSLPQPSAFARKMDELDAHGLDANLRLGLREGQFVRIGGAAHIGVAEGGAFEVGRELPVEFASDPWIAGENQRLLEKAQGLSRVAAASLTKSHVAEAVARYAGLSHTHDQFLRSSDLRVSLPASWSVSDAAMLADGALPADAVGQLQLACVSDADRQALAAANLRAGSNIPVTAQTFAGNFVGDARLQLGNFRDLLQSVSLDLRNANAHASWIDFGSCPDGHFTHVSVPATAFTSVRASVAEIAGVISVVVGGQAHRIVRT